MSDPTPQSPAPSESDRPDTIAEEVDAIDGDGDTTEAPWWMKAVLAGLPFLLLGALLLLDRCRTGF